MRPADEDMHGVELQFTEKVPLLRMVILIASPVIGLWLLSRVSPVMPLRQADPMNSIH
jgi:hypothetical protein